MDGHWMGIVLSYFGGRSFLGFLCEKLVLVPYYRRQVWSEHTRHYDFWTAETGDTISSFK